MTQTSLPTRDGVSASRCFLPKGNWRTILDFLVANFMHISRDAWMRRIESGSVILANGTAITTTAAYLPDTFIFYYRELQSEPHIPFIEKILYHDEHIVVVDKPHFLTVAPTGRFLKETLLVRLTQTLQLPDLAPLHRIDRDTAGLVLFSCNKQTRGIYQTLFQKRQMHKTYEAIAPYMANALLPLTYRSRLVTDQQFFRTAQVEGTPNSETIIDVLTVRGELAHYILKPITGKKHQLRVHMATLGAPIVNDRLYPSAHIKTEDNFEKPLQLLAKSLNFIDPVTQEHKEFVSTQQLDW